MSATSAEVETVTVFGDGPGGGNPAPVVLDAQGLTDADMQEVARSSGHESAFVLPAAEDCDFQLRFWVPRHEMEMCGHATVGAVWLLAQRGRIEDPAQLRLRTLSGVVRARVEHASVEVSQPAGRVAPVDVQSVDAVLDVLGIAHSDLADAPVQNAATSRVKTLVPLANATVLDELAPDFDRVEAVCDLLGSTGLYPYAVTDEAARVVDARQFPRSSGYPEDPATGIAAAALAFGLVDAGVFPADDAAFTIRQGRAMGRPSRIEIRLDGETGDCWLGGSVALG